MLAHVHGQQPYFLWWLNHAYLLVEKEVFQAKGDGVLHSNYSII